MINFKELPSTSEYIKEHVGELLNFDCVFASNQTAGKGRTGHTWEVEPNKNATFSVLVKDAKIINKFNLVSVITAYTIATYLETLGIDEVQIKWPNDVYIRGKKIAGILLEGNYPNYLIIGIGINVNQVNFPNFEAISIKNVFDIKFNPNLVATDIYDLLKDNIKYLPDDLEDIIDELDEKDYLLNKTISFTYNGEELQGIAKGFNLDGTYKVLYNDKVLDINSSEISLVRIK